MNAVEIEEAISALAEQAFDPVEFPFAFLQAFGNKDTTIKRLRAGASNKSDLALQLPCFEMGALSDRLVSSTPERPCDDVCGLDPLSSESDGDAADFLD